MIEHERLVPPNSVVDAKHASFTTSGSTFTDTKGDSCTSKSHDRVQSAAVPGSSVCEKKGLCTHAALRDG